jgi:hypothetical protein
VDSGGTDLLGHVIVLLDDSGRRPMSQGSFEKMKGVVDQYDTIDVSCGSALKEVFIHLANFVALR